MPGFWEGQEEQIELVVGTPHAAVTPVTMDWVGNLLGLDKRGNHRFVSWKGLPVQVSRNATVSDAQKLKAKYLFFLDSDVIPPAYAITRLMSWRLPIVSGLYYSKRGYPAAWKADPELTDKYAPIDFTGFKNEGLVECDVLPMGCCLIDLRVFDVIPHGDKGWFEWSAFNPRVEAGLSEDFSFCKKAREYGFRLWVDSGCRCVHETIAPLSPEGVGDVSVAQAMAQQVKVGAQ